MGGKFTGFHPEGQVPGGEPYPLPEPIAWSRGSVAIRLSPIPCLQQRGPGSLPGMATAVDEHLGSGVADFILLLGEEWRLISQGTLEGRETRGRARKGVAGVLNPYQLLTPGGRVGRD